MAADTSPPAVPDPMLATLGVPPTGAQWAIEFKWDGRGRVRTRGSAVSVYTRNGAEVCAVSAERIPLDSLRYWNADRQEAYASANAATQRLAGSARTGPA